MKYALAIISIILCFIVWYMFSEKEFTTFTHSLGNYKAVCTYYTFKEWTPKLGIRSDANGFIEIFNSKDESMGKVPVPNIQYIGNLVWKDNTVTIKDIAYWNFETGECYWWDEGEKIVVRKAKN